MSFFWASYSSSLLSFIFFAGTGQESVELINLYETNPEVFQASSHSALPIAVSVGAENLNEVSSSVLMAETWLRTHVLAHYPAVKITTIVAGNTVLCDNGQEHKLDLVLPSLKNIYHSLTRWGLEKEIKLSAAFSSNCLHPYSAFYRDELDEKVIKPLLQFLENTNSTYSVKPPPNFSPLSDESVSLVSSHSESIIKLGFFELKNIKVLASPEERKSMSRKLSFISYSVPANIAKKPHSPLSQIASPPSLSFPSAPEIPPVMDPANPPFGFTLPPCNPASPSAPAPETGAIQKLWCVAKPSVPAETLQEAMDYACGAGGADCEEIQPHGNCYNPDTIVAHASYAFNSYWQKHKRSGGTCSFGETAMLINADPSNHSLNIFL
jgi:hypothetical protein